MRTSEIVIIVIFIIAVCAVSLFSFSDNMDLPESSLQVNGIIESLREGLVDGNGNVTSGNVTTGNVTITTPASTTKPANITINFPITINNNVDFITAIVYVLAQPPNQTNDKLSVYNLQSSISKFNTQNSATLLGELSNPNNLTDSRLFLEYINWFVSHCPLDTDTCTGLC